MQNPTPETSADGNSQTQNRQAVSPQHLQQCIGSVPYIVPTHLLRPKDCYRCVYRREDWRGTGHCYMFKQMPEGMYCGQYILDTPAPVTDLKTQCTCTEKCASACKGECGCSVCRNEYCDFLSSE